HETLVGADETLLPTEHDKISCIDQGDNVPSLIEIAHWIQILESDLDSGTGVRERLQEIVQQSREGNGQHIDGNGRHSEENGRHKWGPYEGHTDDEPVTRSIT